MFHLELNTCYNTNSKIDNLRLFFTFTVFVWQIVLKNFDLGDFLSTAEILVLYLIDKSNCCCVVMVNIIVIDFPVKIIYVCLCLNKKNKSNLNKNTIRVLNTI